ncbi:EpsI family protein [Geomonas sp. Red875]|uniref:EpsI family protein n=2 Tax=Geomesophilobacter sediminis TaxID=2798584 RepID=A0A8J7JA60_9BACT|nr:EpsI family protein [Geomesophilobacter sediminis]
MNLHRDLTVPTAAQLATFPVNLNGWRVEGEFAISDEVQKVLRATDVLSRAYIDPQGKRVAVYVGYHAGGKDSGEIHSPKHCLPGSGWLEMSSVRRQLDLPQGKLNLVQAIYRKGESSEMFLYWFQVRDKSISDEFSLKVAEIVNSVLYQRRDASFIRVSVPFEGDERQAQRTAERFITDVLPTLRQFLPG